MAKQKEHAKDLLEQPEALQEKLVNVENWFERNPKILLGGLAALILIVGGFFGFRYYVGNQNTKAQNDMFQAIRYFESDSLKLALNGDANNLGFLQIISDYPFTKAKNLAHYYAGFIYLKQGKYDDAIAHLTDYSSSDLLVQARAYSLIGDAYMELKNYDKAATYYEKASTYKPNKYFTPIYLMKWALACELLNKKEDAIKAYQTILDNYWDAQEAPNAKKYKARLESNS